MRIVYATYPRDVHEQKRAKIHFTFRTLDLLPLSKIHLRTITGRIMLTSFVLGNAFIKYVILHT